MRYEPSLWLTGLETVRCDLTALGQFIFPDRLNTSNTSCFLLTSCQRYYNYHHWKIKDKDLTGSQITAVKEPRHKLNTILSNLSRLWHEKLNRKTWIGNMMYSLHTIHHHMINVEGDRMNISPHEKLNIINTSSFMMDITHGWRCIVRASPSFSRNTIIFWT